MPFYLKQKEILPEVDELKKLLIVPCRFCPATSMAVTRREPYLNILRWGLRTRAYESHIRSLRRSLTGAGKKVDVFESRLPHQFVACMWTSRRRRHLAKRSADYDAVIVLGCDAMLDTMESALGPTGCRIVKGMDSEGIMNVLPYVNFPSSLSLKLEGITPVVARSASQGPKTLSA